MACPALVPIAADGKTSADKNSLSMGSTTCDKLYCLANAADRATD